MPINGSWSTAYAITLRLSKRCNLGLAYPEFYVKERQTSMERWRLRFVWRNTQIDTVRLALIKVVPPSTFPYQRAPFPPPAITRLQRSYEHPLEKRRLITTHTQYRQ